MLGLAITHPDKLDACLHDCRRERSEVVQLLGDDGLNDCQIQAGVFVKGDVAEADHPLHSGCEIGWQDAGGL